MILSEDDFGNMLLKMYSLKVRRREAVAAGRVDKQIYLTDRI